MQPEILAALIGVAGAVLASWLSYRLGKRQNLDQDLHARRVEVTTTVRARVYELRNTGFDVIGAFGDEQDERLTEAEDKFRALVDYYDTEKPWLSEAARQIVENCLNDLDTFLDRARAGGDVAKETEAIEALARLSDRLDNLDEHTSSVVGTHRPWWRRISGR